MYCCKSLKLSCALTLVSVLAFDLPTLAQRTSSMLDNPFFRERQQTRYDASSIDCQNVTEIVFVGVFPCLRGEDSNFVASQNISECDLLSEAAASLAVDRVNQDPDVLPDIKLRLHSTYVSTDEDGDLYAVLMEYLGILMNRSIDRVWGVIGPSGSIEAAETVLSFTANSGVITVSHSIRDTRFDEEIPLFYRTLPSTASTNFGRLVLIGQNKWFRIATLGFIDDIIYSVEREDFLVVFNQFVEEGLFDIDLGLTEVITDSPEASLNNIRSRDINIIMGFFGPENARDILCLADSIGLVSGNHAWVLPSYYSPNWWRISNKGGSTNYKYNCTDQEMQNILESVIFIDGIKVPPVDLSLGEFHSQLMSKAIDLFPSLTEEDLKPYLLRSRATNAYDAVTLLARSVGVAFNQPDGDSCTDTRLQQLALEEIFMECEYCRIFSECFLNTTELMECLELCGSDYTGPELDQAYVRNVTQSRRNLLTQRSPNILNRFGQVLYSQFLNGEECPIQLLWLLTRREFRDNYLSIEQLDETDNCIAQRLNLSRENFVGRETNCSANFMWRGSRDPPSSNFLRVSFIPLGWLMAIGLLVLAGEVTALVLWILNIVLRKYKSIKASSPWLNVILIVGTIIRLPSPLYLGLIFSANGYDGLKGKDLTPVCYLFVWGYYTGGAMFASTLLMKNWRLYRIFHNRQLQFRGSTLTDGVLIAEQMIIVIPVIITLIVMSATGFKFVGLEVPSESFQIINITVCDTAKHRAIYQGVLSGYIFITFILIFILVLLTANVPLSSFRREQRATYRVIIVALLPSSLLTIAQTFLLISEPTLFSTYVFLALEVCWTLLLIILLLLVLVPAIFSVMREKFNEKKSRHEEREHRKLSEHCDDLKHEAEMLKSKLELINLDINKLKTTLHSTAARDEEKDKSDELKEEEQTVKTGAIDRSRIDSTVNTYTDREQMVYTPG